MLRVEGIQSINWNAPDPAAAVRFYTEVLGAQVRARHQVRGVDVVRVRLGGLGIGLFDAAAGPAEGVPHHTLRMAWPGDQAGPPRLWRRPGCPSRTYGCTATGRASRSTSRTRSATGWS